MPGVNGFPAGRRLHLPRVRYRMATRPLFVHCCHCRWCQRETGAAFALNALIESDRVDVLAGEPESCDTPSNSGQGQKIARCPSCHVALWSHYAGAGTAFSFVRVGTLDEPDRLPPDIHIFTSSKQPWVVLPPDAPAVPEYYDRDRYWPAESLERRRVLLRNLEPLPHGRDGRPSRIAPSIPVWRTSLHSSENLPLARLMQRSKQRIMEIAYVARELFADPLTNAVPLAGPNLDDTQVHGDGRCRCAALQRGVQRRGRRWTAARSHRAGQGFVVAVGCGICGVRGRRRLASAPRGRRAFRRQLVDPALERPRGPVQGLAGRHQARLRRFAARPIA